MLQNPAYRLVYPEILDSLLCYLRKRLFVYLAFTVTALTSCTAGRTGSSRPESPQTDIQPADKIPRVSRQEWQFDFDNKPHTYQSITHVNIRTLDSTQSESDTITSIIHFTITADRSRSPVGISGVVDRAEIRTGNKIGVDSSRIALPVNFEGSINDHKVELNLTTPSGIHPTVASPTCTSPAITVLGDIRTLLTTLPERIQTGLKWSDTISTTACNTTGINSTVHALRSYSTFGDTTYFGQEALIIRRTESTELDGRGAQGQHEVTLTGNGTGLTTIYVDRQGVLLAVNTLQNLTLTITASGQSRHFNQHSEQIVKLLD